MTRSPFKPGKFGRELASAGRYKAPPDREQPAPPTLVETLMDEFFSGDGLEMAKQDISLSGLCRLETEHLFWQSVRRAKGLLKPYHSAGSHLDPDAVLGSIVHRLAPEPIAVQVYAGRPLTALVQAFYDLGYNSFLLDLTPLSVRVLDAGNFLRGDDKKGLLGLDIRGETNYTGMNVRYVSLRARGDFYHLAYNGENSHFDFHGTAATFAGGLRECSLDLDGAVEHFGNLCTGTTCRVKQGSTIRYYQLPLSAGNTILYE